MKLLAQVSAQGPIKLSRVAESTCHMLNLLNSPFLSGYIKMEENWKTWLCVSVLINENITAIKEQQKK